MGEQVNIPLGEMLVLIFLQTVSEIWDTPFVAFW
jgi:hypothetical protein